MMLRDDYLKQIKKWRQQIDSADPIAVQEAEKGLLDMADIRPWSIEYICARIALMLQQGTDIALCRVLLQEVDQEFYPHPELVDVFQLLQKTCQSGSLSYQQAEYSACLYAERQSVENYRAHLAEYQRGFQQDPSDTANLRRLAQQYFIMRNTVMYFVLMLLWLTGEGKAEQYQQYMEQEIFQQKNIGYLTKLLRDGQRYTFILVDGLIAETTDIALLERALQLLGHQTMRIGQGCRLKQEHYTMDESVRYTIETAVSKGQGILFRPVVWGEDINDFQDNRTAIINFLAKNIDTEAPVLVFAADALLDKLQEDKAAAKYLQRMTECRPDYFADCMAFAWAGDYTKYISYLYGFSVREKINSPAQCAFSIVLPVRNNAATLRYTLQTCLEQRYTGNYEIVLSDNSDPENHEIYELYQELADARICYYRTPQVLSLTKSFEYAFLQARGEFIFSLGADDGLYPWTLEILEQLIPQMGTLDVLRWRRGTYAWPGFNHGQQNMLQFQLYPQEKAVGVVAMGARRDVMQLFSRLNINLYDLPLLYINSGFRRSYFQRLLQSTGRLWDGLSQDVHMGVVNLAINDVICYTEYPLSIAGLSGRSIGYTSTELEDELLGYGEKLLAGKQVNAFYAIGAYVPNRQEYIFPNFSQTDLWPFYWGILRLCSLGLFNIEEIGKIDWLGVYEKALNNLRHRDILFMKRWGYMKYAFQLHGVGNFISQLDEKVLTVVKKEKIALDDKRVYPVGLLGGQKLSVDAAQFGIKNIYDAVQFSTHILGL